MGNQASQLGDEPGFAGQKDLAHFDHNFRGSLYATNGPFFTATFGEARNADRPINLTCKGDGFSISEDIGIQATKLLEVPYRHITGISWDHSSSQVKLVTNSNGTDSEIILTMANSIELEGELKLRYSAALATDPNLKVPFPMYIGMFAGSTKPKPFQRKRPNLSRLPSGKLPQLQDMRSMAVNLHRGMMKPCNQGESRRVQIAMQHIHEGANTFILLDCRGLPNGIAQMNSNAVLVLSDTAITYKASGRNSMGSEVLQINFEDISEWDGLEGDGRTVTEGLHITAYTEAHGDINICFGVTYIIDVKHTMEFFWNRYRCMNGLPVKKGSTHGRPIETITTLSGEVPPPEYPQGSSDVVDQDGMTVRPGARMVQRRRSVIDSVMSKEENSTVPPENREVRRFWSNIVLHQGWLLKKGGVGLGENKSWIKRYFVLYDTSQGHYLIYYSDFTECPLYTNERNPRNVVDLAKTTFIRPGSNKAEFSDTPPHSFDIVTTEREWTLCAESQENVQKWLKLITRAVDEDVAVLPDEELIFKVKPKVDPLSVLNPNDYSTMLKVSANGISVASPNPAGGGDNEHYFWAYTDFFKWSLLSQAGKLALLVNVFADSTFTRRHEYIFRNKEAVRLATAIEFFIEKFMTAMHISLELTATEDDYQAKDNAQQSSNYASTAEWQKDEQQQANDLVDLLDMQPQDDTSLPTAPVSVPSTTTNETTSFGDDSAFGADPFSADPFSDQPSQAQEKTAPPLTPQQEMQHKVWLNRAVANGGGPLYDDGVLQIATKIEVKLSQARVTLYYRNNGPGSISNLDLKVNDPAGLLRFELSKVSGNLEPLSQASGILMVECMKPASPGPSLSVNYKDSLLGRRSNTLDLPLSAATFNDPLQMSSADFNSKWNQLSAAGQHKQEVFRPAQAIAPDAVLNGLTKALKFGKISGMPDESLYVIYGASSLKTGAPGPNGEKVSVGCLVKIEMNVQSNAIRLTARTLHPAATIAVFDCARQLLG